ncbi:glycosyltransferase family 2 protein [Arthrobacter sp. H14]|uniref:glycosyltransferase family 2 protein n=1 Tax=Arthrobacter sp. H14 TaxID=1312959 RepID=UPI0004BB9226|nr:glycosyltransferase family 2 protein [Arthrobacter sp. H14]
MNTPLLSVIVPAKDQFDYLPDALTSLTGQFEEASALEVIVIDDGSTDGTGEVAAAFASRLPGLHIIRNETPRGLASARNQGLAAANGRYLAYLDGDDWLAPGHLRSVTADIQRLGCDFLRVDHVRCTGNTRSTHRAPQARRSVVLDPRESILPETTATMVDYCYAWAGVFDRRLADAGLLEFPDGLHTAEDRPWAWRLHLEAESYAVVDAPGILYRRGLPTSLTSIYDSRQLDFLPSFEQVFRIVDADREAARFWPKAARMFLAVLSHHIGRSSEMEPDDSRALRSRAKDTLAMIPPPVLATAVKSLDSRRFNAVRPVLPRPVRIGMNAA